MALQSRRAFGVALVLERGQGLGDLGLVDTLFISDKSASVHVSAILRELGVGSRTEAAVRAAGRSDPVRRS